ncbi:MAG: carbonic anhydrase [Dehalococcoidia bacterium]
MAGRTPTSRRRMLKFCSFAGLAAIPVVGGIVAGCGSTERERLYSGNEAATVKPKATAAKTAAGAAADAHAPAAATEAAAAGHAAAEGTAALTPDEALAKLLEGNKRYVSQKLTHPNQTETRRVEVATGQHPFCAVIGCIDSRVAPEIVFDQGLGDLLTMRVGAAIADDSIVGSTEFGVEEFHIPLVVVLGHERCGAVKATLDAVKAGKTDTPGQIGAVVGPIVPAVKSVLGKGADELDLAVRASTKLTVDAMKASPVLAELIHAGKVKIVGARYDLDSGAVEILA